MNFNTDLIKELRKKTGVGILQCKKALLFNKGDIEKSIDYLRIQGISKSQKINSRSTLEGIVLIKKKNSCSTILEINCETDFVSRNEEFNIFSNDVINFIIDNKISDIKKVQDFFETKRINLVSKFGENIIIQRCYTMENLNTVFYLHNFRIGVIVAVTNNSYIANKKFIKNIAMHIAASNPKYISVSDIPPAVINREYDIQFQLTKKLNKNTVQESHIIKGKMDKFINEISLVNQPFIFNTSKTVKEVLEEKNIKILSFIRYELGEKNN
ncbi:Elongation factor Ts [Buchnera aphidicola (Thelaxes suberi)]|uniref:translation elongation factor Ts n=1 Tax=Buchnera aphidicola TaxID=9 RepID=UPI003463BD19